MVMGPTHAMSGAAAWLIASGVYSTVTHTPIEPAVLLLGTAVAAGGALAPDIDSNSSTVVRSFGILGTGAHHVANAISLGVYNLTKTRKDDHIENGHRTLFHTTAMAVLAGGLTALATAATGTVEILGQTFSWGQVFALIIMAIFLNLGLAGVFEKQIKKARRKFGPYLLIATSLILTFITAYFLPPADGSAYSWLGLAVGFGCFMHLLGDAITKMGVPMAWPLRIHGKAWWDVSLPSFMRIRAGGKFEYAILLPLVTAAAIGGLVWNLLMLSGVIK